MQILCVPGAGWLPFLTALALAGALAAGTFKAMLIAAPFGAIALVCILLWLWSMDRPYLREGADAGRGVTLPLYVSGSDSVGWWGMVVLLISDAAVMASFAFAYMFLWTGQPGAWPPDGSLAPQLLEPLALGAAVLLAWGLFEAASMANARERPAQTRMLDMTTHMIKPASC